MARLNNAGQLASAAAQAMTTGSAQRAAAANTAARQNAQMAANFNYNAMKEQQAFNAEQARINREWQERMANTAYQRAVADMKRAGLNPALAYNQGGAASPGGGSASSARRNIAAPQTFQEQVTSMTTIADALNAIGGILGNTTSSGVQENAQAFVNDLMNWWRSVMNGEEPSKSGGFGETGGRGGSFK